MIKPTYKCRIRKVTMGRPASGIWAVGSREISRIASIVSTFASFMKTRTLKKDKVNIITLGCSKNMVDSEVLSGQLRASDIDVVHENTKKDHNIVVVNTCGFIE